MRLAEAHRSISSMSSTSKHNLEKPAEETAACLAQGPGLSELPLAEVRKSIETPGLTARTCSRNDRPT